MHVLADPIVYALLKEFRQAVDVIRSLRLQDQPNLSVYCSNIQEKAEYFREGCK